MPAWRRINAFGDPTIEIRQRCAMQRQVVEHVERIAGDRPRCGVCARLSEVTWRVLRAGEKISPRRRMLSQVVLTRRVNVCERGVSSPVLRSAVGEDDLWQVAGRGEPVEEPARAASQGIGGHHAGKRKDVAPQWRCLVRGLREAMIEGTTSCAGDVHVEAVIGTTAILAAVEAETQEMPLHAPGLRDAVEDKGSGRVATWIGGGGGAQERRHVAGGKEAEASHRRAVGLVDELVDAPRLETPLKPHVLGRRLHGASWGLTRQP